MSFDPAFCTAAQAVAAVRSKQISVSELVGDAFACIRRENPAINAVVVEFQESKRSPAQGPLHGVPITIKESFAYAGTPSTWGLPELASELSSRTAVAVERLEAAGAVTLGKTNVPVLLTDWQSHNPVYGTTNNPWDLSLTPGGSSGGSSAALAAGIGCIALGSDIGGSIRLPAHFCGLYGHKPTVDLVPLSGHAPGAWHGTVEPSAELPVAGPLARSARDLRLALEAMAGPCGDGGKAWTWRLPTPRHTRLCDFRVGYVLDDPDVPVAPDVRAVYESLFERLRGAGVDLVESWPEGADAPRQFATYRYLLDALLGAIMPGDPIGLAAASHARWYQENRNRSALRSAWRKWFEQYDVFLMPAAFTAAFPHDHSPRDVNTLGHCTRIIQAVDGQRPYRDLLYWFSMASVTGLPATVAPAGLTRAGLPCGIQIVGPMWEDATPIEFAALMEEVAGGFIAPRDRPSPPVR